MIGPSHEDKDIFCWLHHAGEKAAETEIARNDSSLGLQLGNGAGVKCNQHTTTATTGLLACFEPPSQLEHERCSQSRSAAGRGVHDETMLSRSCENNAEAWKLQHHKQVEEAQNVAAAAVAAAAAAQLTRTNSTCESVSPAVQHTVPVMWSGAVG